MKKFISLLAAVGLTATTAGSVVSCGVVNKTINPKDTTDPTMFNELNNIYDFRSENNKLAKKAGFDGTGKEKLNQDFDLANILIPLIKINGKYQFGTFDGVAAGDTVDIVMVKAVNIVTVLNGTNGKKVLPYGSLTPSPLNGKPSEEDDKLTDVTVMDLLDSSFDPNAPKTDTPKDIWNMDNLSKINTEMAKPITDDNKANLKPFMNSISEMSGKKIDITISKPATPAPSKLTLEKYMK